MPQQASQSKHRINHIAKPAIATILLSVSIGANLNHPISAENATISGCQPVHVIFARGSGEQLNDVSYQTFRQSLQPLLSGINAKFYELGTSSQNGFRYNAVSIGTESLGQLQTTIGAFISGGNSYAFGKSVSQGVNELKSYITSTLTNCPDSQFVLGGYSQGAMVMDQVAKSLDPNRLIYLANFGDPKLYLPEGYGPEPAACSNPDSLSSYRVYAPDCHTYQGVLGGYKPYQPSSAYEGKIGIWCNYHDLMCSRQIDWDNLFGAHTSYISDGRYDDAARIISEKIHSALNLVSPGIAPTSTQDIAILIDATGSMHRLIEDYKAEALRLATDTLLHGGRVALYVYRDLATSNTPILLCNFSTCNLSNLQEKLDNIIATGGGEDAAESLLSASLIALNRLKWQVGANKSIVVLTDAGFHNPDRDHTTLSQVITRSLEVDPVHFYLLAPANAVDDDMRQLANATGGRIFNTESELSLSTDLILDLPAEPPVFDYGSSALPAISSIVHRIEDNSLHIDFDGNAYRYLLILNDDIYGFTEEKLLTITDLDFCSDNSVVLVPYSASGEKGESRTLQFSAKSCKTTGSEATSNSETPQTAQTRTSIGLPNSGFYSAKQ